VSNAKKAAPRKKAPAKAAEAAPPSALEQAEGAPPERADIHALLAGGAAKRAEDFVSLCLAGDLNRQWAEAKRELDRLSDPAAGQGRLTDGSGRRRIAAQMHDIEERMRAATVDFTVRALRRKRTGSTPADEPVWSELVDQHPPRSGKDGKPHPQDGAGVNMAEFPEALIRASVVDPVLTDEEWDQLLGDALNDYQFDRLFEACWRLNRNGVNIPFSHAASKILNSEAGSRRQNGSASA